jgi:holo-[acyl-carrier protein] synthase
VSSRPPFSVGLDIIEVDRVASLAKRNPRFLRRVFTADERRYCLGKKKKWQHFAVRFAAKEAVWKALGLRGLALRDISVQRDRFGRPSVTLEGRPAGYIQISLSHSDTYAAAVAVLLKPPAGGRGGV